MSSRAADAAQPRERRTCTPLVLAALSKTPGGRPITNRHAAVMSQNPLSTLNAPAETALKQVVDTFAGDVLAEAGRLEANLNTSGKNPEITSSMILDAALFVRRGFARPRKHMGLRLAQILAAVGGFTTGLLADADKLKDTSTLVMFIVLLAVTITALVIAIMKE